MSESALPLMRDARRTRRRERTGSKGRQCDRRAALLAFAGGKSRNHRVFCEGLAEHIESTSTLLLTGTREIMGRFDDGCNDREVTLERARTLVDAPILVGGDAAQAEGGV